MLGMEDLRRRFSEPPLVICFETHAIDHLGQACGALQFAPALFRPLRQLEDHRQDASARDAAACFGGPQPHRGEG